MTYLIAEPCVDARDRACVQECPVDCIDEGERSLYIHPDECIDCGARVPPRRRIPVLGGPEVETLTATGTFGRVAVVHRAIPAGGVPEHGSGPSQIVVLLSGAVRMTSGGTERRLERGSVAHTGTGERISVTNPGNRTRRADARRVARGYRRAMRRVAAGLTGDHRCAQVRPLRRSRAAPSVLFRRRPDRAPP